MDSFVATLVFYTLAFFVSASFTLFLSLVLYLYYVHKISDHLPGPPRSSFFLGHFHQFSQSRQQHGSVMEYVLEQQVQYGPVYVLFIFHRTLVFIGDPRYVREVFIEKKHILRKDKHIYQKLGFIFGQRLSGNGLVTNVDHASWRARRQLMNPAFHRKSLKNFMKDFNEVCDRFLVRMMNVVEERETSMAKEFARVTLDVISKVSFNINIGAIENPNTPFATAITSSLKGIQHNINIPVNSSIISLFQFVFLQFESYREQINAAKFLREFAVKCITKRINDIEDNIDVPNDLLTLLVKDKILSLEDTVDEFLTIFIAGQETTANSLAFTLFEIARNPDIEKKVLSELHDILGSKEYVDFEDLVKLKYLGQVMQESLRKHPIVATQGKVLTEEISVGGYKIPKGTLVNGSMYVLNHDPKIWKNPNIFDPDRFSAPEKIPYFSTTYFPFSIGDRNCIGQTFAKYESKVILSRLLLKFRFKLLPGQTAAIESRLTLASKDGVLCEVTKR